MEVGCHYLGREPEVAQFHVDTFPLLLVEDEQNVLRLEVAVADAHLMAGVAHEIKGAAAGQKGPKTGGVVGAVWLWPSPTSWQYNVALTTPVMISRAQGSGMPSGWSSKDSNRSFPPFSVMM